MRRPLLSVALSALIAAPPICCASEAPQAAPEAQSKKVECIDVALSNQGLLTGQLVDPQGNPIADAPVWIADGRRKPVAAQTAADGRFGYRELKPGLYSLQTGDAVKLCRVWSHKAAPPKSISGVMLVAHESAVRAQSSAPPLLNGFVQRSKKFFAHPVGMVTIGAAIAAPIAIVAADDDDPASP